MPLFDRYLIVDWSAANSPKKGKDSIWIADCDSARVPVVSNMPTRFLAMQKIAETLDEALESGQRVFAGFDFGFGYPEGGSNRVSGEASWHTLWQRIHELVEDDENNRSNRFEVAAELNENAFPDYDGPFWGYPSQHDGQYKGLGATRPSYNHGIGESRIVETVVSTAQPVWKLAYTGSVGSQTLLGIKHLEMLRRRFADQVSIWPFETGFAEDLSRPVIVAEVYPSLFPLYQRAGEIRDAAQVRSVASRFAMNDAQNGLVDLLSRPPCLDEEQAELVLREEGWIVGAGIDDRPWEDCLQYVKEPAEIYRHSFATVEREADIGSLPEDIRDVAVRLIHSCGMIDVVDDLAFSKDAVSSGKQALATGKPVYVDVEMVKAGIIERLLPSGNSIVCTLNHPNTPENAKAIGNTRSAAAVDFWDDLDGSVVVIGNAPTALYRLLETIRDGGAKPALVIGVPVGFVGAEESKHALETNPYGIEYITVRGRRGGSAMASAILNGLAGGRA